jgi:Ca2+-binding RTX toxin-like protein
MGNGGHDLLVGGTGDDSLYGHEGNDSLWGGAGNDLLHGLQGDDVINGGSGNDVAEGGEGSDTINGGDGNDGMQGEGGNDVLLGAVGDDTVEGNAGDDLLLGGTGTDHLAGHDGNDTLVGGDDNGRVNLVGGTVVGLALGDTIYGDGGADLLIYRKGDGVDVLPDFKPSEGDQLDIYGYTGFAAVTHVGTSTVLYLGENAAIVLTDWYPAQDLAGPFPGITFKASSNASTDDALVAAHTPPGPVQDNGTPPGHGVWQNGVLQGTDGNDNLVAPGASNRIVALAGDDTIEGGETDASIDAGSGNNLIHTSGWNNSIVAGDGMNVLTGPAGNTTVRFGNGSAHIILDGWNNHIEVGVGDNVIDAGSGNETVVAKGGNNIIIARGYSDQISTGAGNDVISGPQGNAIINVGDGDNHVSVQGLSNQIATGAGSDTIIAGEGNAEIHSGEGKDDVTVIGWGNHISTDGGDDTVWIRPGAGDGIIDGGTGLDTVVLPGAFGNFRIGAAGGHVYVGSSDSQISYELRGIERLAFSDQTTDLSTLLAEGKGEEMASVSKNGASTSALLAIYTGPVGYLRYELLGSETGEVARTTASNDFLNLLGGDDAADAAGGDDVIDGGTGSNFLVGGAGHDVFFLDGRSGQPTWATIVDWEQGEQLSVWGWRPGVSTVLWVDRAGAGGYEGITMHADLNGDSAIDTSVTWTGLARAQLPSPHEYNGLLWFT